MIWIKKIQALLFSEYRQWPAGRFGEIKENKYIYCLFYNEWIGGIVPCMDICSDRTTYLEQIEKNAPANFKKKDSFVLAAQHAGFKLPQELGKAVKFCMFCEVHSGDGVEEIPSVESIDIDELLLKLYG